MHNFMSTLGYDYKMSLNEKKITTAEKYAADMPTWPGKRKCGTERRDYYSESWTIDERE